MTSYRPRSSSTASSFVNRLLVLLGVVLFILLLTPTFIYARSKSSGHPYSSRYISTFSLSPHVLPSRYSDRSSFGFTPSSNTLHRAHATISKTAIAYHASVITLSILLLLVLALVVIPKALSTYRRQGIFPSSEDNPPHPRRPTFLCCMGPLVALALFTGIITSPILATALRVSSALERVWIADQCTGIIGEDGLQHKAVVTWELDVVILDDMAMDGTAVGGKMWITKARKGRDGRDQELEFVGKLESDGGYVLKYSKGAPEMRSVEDVEYCDAGECFAAVEITLPPINALGGTASPSRNLGNSTFTGVSKVNPSIIFTETKMFTLDGTTSGYGQTYGNRCIPWTPYSLLSIHEPSSRSVLTTILFATAMEMAQESVKRRDRR